MTIEAFMGLFRFNSKKAFNIGVEQELFIVDQEGRTVPRAPEVLALLDSRGISSEEFGYELSACQLETRTGPCELPELRSALAKTNGRGDALLHGLGLSALRVEVGPEDMPLDVFPDPTGRYQQITKHMPLETLLAACRVIGTHVHVGMRSHEEALRVYNYVIRYFAELCELGNGSFGERLAIYRQMAPDYQPQPYTTWKNYYQTAVEKGFAEDPRKCWTLIRISVHGTIEFRMFGATDSVDRITRWAVRCHELCEEAFAVA